MGSTEARKGRCKKKRDCHNRNTIAIHTRRLSGSRVTFGNETVSKPCLSSGRFDRVTRA
ncbi:hypothetical protein AKJ09_07078 [Labilithrix luteola]|uniref:Uncharacterized protein n=1 Tax=Labilithrix luteola TaxID=1391654 RepID=A0A0K1Q4T5_9BACT|nr:hypothetical protein AKJ09_07078 [Labilithrix luteola]